jgi:hypothetical protein
VVRLVFIDDAHTDVVVYHSSEIPFVYGAVSNATNSSTDAVELSHQMMEYWCV